MQDETKHFPAKFQKALMLSFCAGKRLQNLCSLNINYARLGKDLNSRHSPSCQDSAKTTKSRVEANEWTTMLDPKPVIRFIGEKKWLSAAGWLAGSG
jgi:hypothetical protein